MISCGVTLSGITREYIIVNRFSESIF